MRTGKYSFTKKHCYNVMKSNMQTTGNVVHDQAVQFRNHACAICKFCTQTCVALQSKTGRDWSRELRL